MVKNYKSSNLKPHFQKNKDWNIDNRADLLNYYFLKPHFQKNKDWNIEVHQIISELHKLKTPLPEKQGLKQITNKLDEHLRMDLKPHFQKNKDWNFNRYYRHAWFSHLKTPLPEKQGLKHSRRINCCGQKSLKPHFQKNKDWNYRNQPLPKWQLTGLKPHFQKNKDWNQYRRCKRWYCPRLKTPLPEKQGLKLSISGFNAFIFST